MGKENATDGVEMLLRNFHLPTMAALYEAAMTRAEAEGWRRRQLPNLLDGGFAERATNLLAFGLPGRGKTHCLAAIGRELIVRLGIRVLS